MATRSRRKRANGAPRALYDLAIYRALGDALYQKLIDECWEEVSAVFDDPEVKATRHAFLQSIVTHMAKQKEKDGKASRRSRGKKGG